MEEGGTSHTRHRCSQSRILPLQEIRNEMNNIEFLNMVGRVHQELEKIKIGLEFKCPEIDFGKVDLSFYSIDRNNFPGSPIGISWEIDIKNKNEYFTFEFINELGEWNLNGHVSKHQDLELLEKFIEVREKNILDLSPKIKTLLIKFERECLTYLQSRNFHNEN